MYILTSGHEYAEDGVGANSFYWHNHIHRVVQGNRAGEGRGGEDLGTILFCPDCALLCSTLSEMEKL